MHKWEDEVVVYDIQSGDTHLLGALAGTILGKLASSSEVFDERTLIGEVAREWGVDPDDDFLNAARRVLSDLQTLSLVVRG